MLKRIFRYTFGIFFLILGVVGLFLPILQGILFIIVGLLILAPESKRIQRLLDKLRRRYPAIFAAAERTRDKFTRKFRKNSSAPEETPGREISDARSEHFTPHRDRHPGETGQPDGRA